MIKKAYNQIFNGNINVSSKLNIDLNSRPQNLDYETYFNLTKEYEFLRVNVSICFLINSRS